MTGLEPILGVFIAAVIADAFTNGWVRRSLADGAREGVRRTLPAVSAVIRRPRPWGLRGDPTGASPQHATTAPDDHPGTLRMPGPPVSVAPHGERQVLRGRPGRAATETLHGDPAETSPEGVAETRRGLRRRGLRRSGETLRRVLPGVPSVALTSRKTRRVRRDWRLTINVNTSPEGRTAPPTVRPSGDPPPAVSPARPEPPPPTGPTTAGDSPTSPAGESPAATPSTSPDASPETQPQTVQEDTMSAPAPAPEVSAPRITESVSAHIAEGLDLAVAVQDVVEQYGAGITDRVGAHVASAEAIPGFPPSLQGDWVDGVRTPLEEAWALLQRAADHARLLADREEAELRPLVEAADQASSDASELTVGVLRTE